MFCRQINLTFSFCSWFFFSSYLLAQDYPNSGTEFPRLCVYHRDPSQYYPCILNYIGLHSWSLYRCPQRSTFDETSQQCLVKIPVNDAFEQLASFPTTQSAEFHHIASFVLATPRPNEEEEEEAGLVSFPPTIDQFIEPISRKRNLHQRTERDIHEDSSSIIWSHGLPLMKVNKQLILAGKSKISSRISHFSVVDHQHVPVNEDELKYKKVCYFTNWSQYRPVSAKFEPEHIDPFLCTHLVYAFAHIHNRTLSITKVEDNDEDLYRRINALKIRNPKLKTLLAIGGWNMKSHAFSAMMHHSIKRRTFVLDTINFLRQRKFDGLEVDWEYPGIRGGKADDKTYLTLFLQEFKDAATAQAIISGQSRLLLAAAVSAEQDIVETGYEIEKISKILDFINVMTYDFHGAWQNHTGLSAPLYKRFDETHSDAMRNQDSGISLWLKHGAPAHKLVLGIPLFARSFLLARADQNQLYSPTIGNGTEAPFTRTSGFLAFFEVCLLQTDKNWQRHSVPDGSESEYMFKGRQWISYETIDNIQKRAAYVVAKNLGGMFIWSLDMDDFSGNFCRNGTYPFIKNSLSLLPSTMPSYV